MTSGHNILPAVDVLKKFIERVETLLEEKKGVADDIKDVMSEAKSAGFDTKTIRAVIRLRAMDAAARVEQKALLDSYAAALGLSEFA